MFALEKRCLSPWMDIFEQLFLGAYASFFYYNARTKESCGTLIVFAALWRW